MRQHEQDYTTSRTLFADATYASGYPAFWLRGLDLLQGVFQSRTYIVSCNTSELHEPNANLVITVVVSR